MLTVDRDNPALAPILPPARYALVSVGLALAVVGCSLPAQHASYDASPGAADVSIAWELTVPQVIGMAADSKARLFVHRTDEHELLALDSRDGSPLWSQQLPSEQAGVRHLLVDAARLYALGSTNLTSYEPSNGKPVWTAPLGAGHVSMLMDDWPDAVKVYYGDSMILVSKDTGATQGQQPLEDVLWIVPPIEVHSSSIGMYGVEASTGVVTWRTEARPFWATEVQPPLHVGGGRLLVFVKDEGTCLFDTAVGEYRWCTKQKIVSNVVADSTAPLAYGLTETLDLVSLDLADGAAQRLASFTRTKPGDPNLIYEFGVAAATGRVYAYFADTGQLFAVDIGL